MVKAKSQQAIEMCISVFFLTCILIIAILQVVKTFVSFNAWTPITVLLAVGICIPLILKLVPLKKSVRSETNKSKDNTTLLLILFLIFCIIVRICLLFYVKTEPISDFQVMYDSALLSTNGDYSWMNTGYFIRFPFQIPFVLYESHILKLFGTIQSLIVFNIIWELGSITLIYLIGCEYTNRRTSLFIAFLYSILPMSLVYTTVLTNQHLSLFLGLLGIYLYLLSKKSLKNVINILLLILSGIALALGKLIRGEVVLILIALLVIRIIELITATNKRQTLLHIIVLLATYLVFTKGIALLLQCTNLAPNGIGNPYWTWKFVLGLDFNGSGTYSELNTYIFNIDSVSERTSEMFKIIQNSYAGLGNAIKFFLKKMFTFWNNSNAILDFTITDLSIIQTKINPLPILQFENAFRLIIYALCVFSSITTIKDRSSNQMTLLQIIIIITLFVFLLIEVQTRYRYFVDPFVFLMLCGVKRKAVSDYSIVQGL